MRSLSLFTSACVLLATAAATPASAAHLPQYHIPGLPRRPPPLPVEAPEPTRSWTGRWFNFWPLTLIHTGEPGQYTTLEAQYDGQVVLRFNVSTVDHEAALGKAAEQMSLDVWDFAANYTDLRIPKRRIRALLSLLPKSMQTEHMILIEDVARAVAATYPSPKNRLDLDAIVTHGQTPVDTKNRGQGVNDLFKHKMDDLFFKDYQPLSVITTWMQYIDTMFRFDQAGLVTMFSIGKSYEGRDIPALRVGLDATKHHSNKKKKPRKTMLITGGLHAREWISVSTVNYLAFMFASHFGKNELITSILEEFDLVFVPVVNPDGYEYTWSVDRLWRKSRQRTSMRYCHGFDLDHSFGYRWDGPGRNDEPCSEGYGGDRPFEAVEALQLAQWAKNQTRHNVDLVAYFDLHSYSQQVLWPYAYSCDAKVPNLENMQEVAMNIAKYMRLSTGEVYNVGSACESAVARGPAASDTSMGVQRRRIEAAGGSAIDYFHHDLKARYSFQIKLRDTGSYGFLLPSESIVPVGDEVFEAVKFLGDYLLGNNGIERGHAAPQATDTMTTGRPSLGFELRRKLKR
ncbi:uncharacterized protein JN550_008841 [Neoarthrinium moseri]|uniref:uncharacterized protein n=1 Tax=Neoarthrinium moseri TaxID=1658444 RepID=UPI001FDE2D92|nr:uncharacterized protein JN550_008841 [Neoarthrinium moseri]KAI1864554.1 hypothetical protein JN550_008841 [Neoarthrinium moseri]